MRLNHVVCGQFRGRLALVVFLTILPACGPGNPTGRRPVDGRIALDGKPLESGSIQFVSDEPGGLISGAMISGGDYRVDVKNGLRPGKYHVQISSPQNAEGSKSHKVSTEAPTALPPPSIERVPPKYNSATTLTIEVTASGSTRFDFDVKSSGRVLP